MSDSHGAAGGGGQQARQVSASKLVGTLSGFGAVAGLLIVVAFQWAQPRIDAYKAKVLNDALNEVIGAPASIKELTIDGEPVYAGYDAQNKLIGYAIIGAEPGFADVITVLFAYDPAQKRLIGMKVLDNKETPGLGDKIVKDSSFVNEFKSKDLPLVGVKHGQGKGAKNEVDMITGVTISSRTVIGIINRKLEKVEPLLPKEPQP